MLIPDAALPCPAPARPALLQVPATGDWVCGMHPAEEWRQQGCDAPEEEEALHGLELASCPG